MRQKLSTKLRQVTHNVYRNIAATRVRRRVIERFAKSNGMIYFGSVDQKKDDHKIIRGVTASSSQVDNHFSVGTVDTYDVSLVDRSDCYIDSSGKCDFCDWLVVAVELKNGADIPHIFVGANNHEIESYERLFTTETAFVVNKLGIFENYPEDFVNSFFVYSPVGRMIETQKLLPANSARVIGSHLWPFSFEVKDETVYVYSKNDKINNNTLTSMLSIGIWLARHLDYMSNQI